MNETIKLLLVVVIIAVIITSLTGCSDEYGEPIDLVIIFTDTANHYKYNDQHYALLRPFLNRAVYGGKVHLILADGEPRYTEILSLDTGMPAFNSSLS